MVQWYLNEAGEPASREITPEELETARWAACAKLEANPQGFAMRSCWVCNPAHAHFLTDLMDGFLFTCIGDCGHWYYQGIDITVKERGVA